MADSSSTANLYLSVTQLSYAETQLAINPRPPFILRDRHDLRQQCAEVANCATRLRQKDCNALDQLQVFSSQRNVDTAMSMFNVIQSHPSNNYTKEQVREAVKNAIAAVDALSVGAD